jgi:hypothetical protein
VVSVECVCWPTLGQVDFVSLSLEIRRLFARQGAASLRPADADELAAVVLSVADGSEYLPTAAIAGTRWIARCSVSTPPKRPASCKPGSMHRASAVSPGQRLTELSAAEGRVGREFHAAIHAVRMADEGYVRTPL